MITRAATLLAAASLAAVAVPAFAQDDYHPGPPPPLPEVGGAAWDEDWDGDWDEYSEPAYEEGAKWDRRRGYWERRHRSPRAAMGYSEDQRARWIEQCRANYEDASGSRRGA